MSYQEEEPVLNYWGYKQGYYFAPKAAYAATEQPVNEFKELIKALHRLGMELIMLLNMSKACILYSTTGSLWP